MRNGLHRVFVDKDQAREVQLRGLGQGLFDPLHKITQESRLLEKKQLSWLIGGWRGVLGWTSAASSGCLEDVDHAVIYVNSGGRRAQYSCWRIGTEKKKKSVLIFLLC